MPPCVKLSYKDIRSPFFQIGMRKLSGHPFRDQKVGYRVMRIVDAIESEQAPAEKLYIKLLKQYADLDEKGDFVPRDGMPNTFVVTKNFDEYEKALKDFEELSFEMKWRKIPLDDLSEIHLSPTELKALAQIIEFPED